LQQANRALLMAVIDVALIGFGATKTLQLGGLALGRKEALVVGLDLVTGNRAQVASALVQTLVGQGLVAATGSAALAATIASLLDTGGTASAANVVSTLSAAAGGTLTDVQKDVLGSLSQETRFNVTPLVQAVIAEPALNRAQA